MRHTSGIYRQFCTIHGDALLFVAETVGQELLPAFQHTVHIGINRSSAIATFSNERSIRN